MNQQYKQYIKNLVSWYEKNKCKTFFFNKQNNVKNFLSSMII